MKYNDLSLNYSLKQIQKILKIPRVKFRECLNLGVSSFWVIENDKYEVGADILKKIYAFLEDSTQNENFKDLPAADKNFIIYFKNRLKDYIKGCGRGGVEPPETLDFSPLDDSLNLKNIRQILKLSQEQMAELFFISRKKYFTIEGANYITFDTLSKLHIILNIALKKKDYYNLSKDQIIAIRNILEIISNELIKETTISLNIFLT